MAGAGRHVWSFVILCVSLLFISGIILPKLWSKYYYELRSELNETLIFDFDEILAPNNETAGDAVNVIYSNNSYKNSETSEREQYNGISSVTELSILQIPTVKRSKRQASDEDDNEYFAWNFNLNISRYKKPSSMNFGSIKPDAKDFSKNNLDAAIYLAGNGPGQSSNLHRGLDSAGAFIRRVFGEKVEKLTLGESQKIDEDTFSLKGNLQTDSGTQNAISDDTDKSTTHAATQSKKSGRFLLELFGFGRTSTAKPVQSPKSKVSSEVASESTNELSSISGSSNKSETDVSIGRDNFGFTGFQEFEGSKMDFQTEALVSESEHTSVGPQSCSTKDKCEPLGSLKGFTEASSQELKNITEVEECTDCEFFHSTKENELSLNDSFSKATQFSARSFTDEKLEEFCMNLVHELGESRLFITVNDSSKKDEKSEEINLSPSSEIGFDCLNLRGSLKEKPKTDHGVIEDSFLVSTNATLSNGTLTNDTERDARIFSWFRFGFGSGRSELDGQISEESIDPFSSSASTKDTGRDPRVFDLLQFGLGSGRSGLDVEIIEENLDESNSDNVERVENEPTIADCVSYFREKQNVNMFPKPNLMDIISDSNIEIADFANATISPKLKEQQIQFIIDLLENSENRCVLAKDDKSTDSVKVVFEEGDEFSLEKPSTTGIQMDNGNGEILTRTPVADFKWISTAVKTEGDFSKEIPQTTEIQRDERIFGFGSGSDASPETDELRFISSRNGERLNETGSAAEIKFAVDSATRTVYSEHIETGCEKDCILENASVTPDNCSDECHSGPFRQNVSLENPQNHSSNENDCHDCSLLRNDSNRSGINEKIFHGNSELNEGSLTSDDLKSFNKNCSCHEHYTDFIPENARNLECDCSLSTEGILHNDFNTEKNPLKTVLENHASIGLNRDENDCDDCDDRNQPEKKMQGTESDPFISESSADSRSFKDVVSGSSLGSSELQAVVTDTDHTKAVEIVTEFSFHEELETEQNSSRIFLGSIFLAGSGDGDLSGDSRKRINVTEEISPEKLPRRRGRLDDPFADMQEKQDIPKETAKYNPDHLVTTEDSNINGKELKPRTDQFEVKSKETFPTKATTESFSFEVFSRDSSGNILTTPESQPKPCNSASECNTELNERCVTSSPFPICGCIRAFVRSKITRKCVKKSSYRTELKLPAEEFEEDLGNPVSPRYKQRQQDANKLMYNLLKDNPSLLRMISEITFEGFSQGSLIMRWEIIFAAENKSDAEIESLLQNDLNRALLHEKLTGKVPFNVSKAYVQSISNAMDPCLSTELNYCHRNSLCVRNRLLPGGYECRCKEDYIDVSRKPEYPAENCEALCSSDYCGNHGRCVWVPETGRHCVCTDWYFGDRCGISGKVVVAGFSANVFLFMILVLILVICKARRSRSRNYGRSSRRDLATHAIAAGRVSDVIAMEENVGTKVAKISHISTPVQNVPTIKVVRPTLSESSISVYDDSTFDITPSSDSGRRSAQQEPS